MAARTAPSRQGQKVPGSPARQSRRVLLEHPAVAVRVAERGKRCVAAVLRIRAADPSLVIGVVEHTARGAEVSEVFHDAGDEPGSGCIDVGHDEVQEALAVEYLVTMTTHVPDGTPGETVDEIGIREAARAREVAATG